MNMKRETGIGMRALAGAAALAVVMTGLTACNSGGGGGGDVPSGASTIQGTVESFASGNATYLPVKKSWGERVLAGMANVLVQSAYAAIGGVSVSIEGATAVTEEDGLFIISGVPPGEREIVFTYNGETVTMPIFVPENAVVKLEGVRVEGGQARVREIEIEVDDTSGSDDTSDDPSDDSLDDDSLDDDSQNDDSDDVSDDDSGDNSGSSGNSGSGSDDDSNDD